MTSPSGYNYPKESEIWFKTCNQMGVPAWEALPYPLPVGEIGQ